MKKNVGTIDALIRIAFGLFGLAWGISKMVSNPRRRFPLFIAFFSAMKAAEGMTRFCPGLAALGLNTIDSERKGSQTSHRSHNRANSYREPKLKQAPQVSPYEKEDRGTLHD